MNCSTENDNIDQKLEHVIMHMYISQFYIILALN